MDTGLVVAIALAVAFALTNGFHDAANAIAALVATGAATPFQAIVLACVFNLLGPLLLGAAVADTIGGIVIVAPSAANRGDRRGACGGGGVERRDVESRPSRELRPGAGRRSRRCGPRGGRRPGGQLGWVRPRPSGRRARHVGLAGHLAAPGSAQCVAGDPRPEANGTPGDPPLGRAGSRRAVGDGRPPGVQPRCQRRTEGGWSDRRAAARQAVGSAPFRRRHGSSSCARPRSRPAPRSAAGGSFGPLDAASIASR